MGRAVGGLEQDIGVLRSVRATSNWLVSYFFCTIPLGGFTWVIADTGSLQSAADYFVV